MSHEEHSGKKHDSGATISRDPERGLELKLEKDPGDKQAQADLGSDESMDASDPPSACQPDGDDPSPSNDFPQTNEGPASTHPATHGRVVQTPSDEKPYKVIIEHEDGQVTERPVDTMNEGEAIIRDKSPTPTECDQSFDRPPPD